MALFLEDAEPSMYSDVPKQRGDKVFDFATSMGFTDGLAVATITSLARWHMARALFPGPESTSSEAAETDGVESEVGLNRAISVCLSDTSFFLPVGAMWWITYSPISHISRDSRAEFRRPDRIFAQ